MENVGSVTTQVHARVTVVLPFQPEGVMIERAEAAMGRAARIRETARIIRR